jgi:hypothetical protein
MYPMFILRAKPVVFSKVAPLLILTALIVSFTSPLLLPETAKAAQPAFELDNRQPFGDGQDSTQAVAVGDMNNDGYLDIVTLNSGKNDRSSIYLASASGFSQGEPDRIFGAMGSSTTSLALGDFNRDGHLDAVVADNDQAISLFLNDGNANLALETSFGGPATSVAAGDLNGDGHLDIVTSGSPAQVFLNSGANTFVPGGNLDDEINAVALGDVDGDGWLDIVAGTMRAQISLYLNVGDGTFSSRILFGTVREPFKLPCTTCGILRIELGDLNNDGVLDITTSSNSETRVYRSTASDIPTYTETSVDPERNRDNTAVSLGDIDNDGALDLVVGRGFSEANMIYLNDGSNGFIEESGDIPFGTGIDPTRSIALADLNRDGALDIVVGNDTSGGADSQNAVYLSNRAGDFARHTTTRFGIDDPSGSTSINERSRTWRYQWRWIP